MLWHRGEQKPESLLADDVCRAAANNISPS
jgi:hypothetical protein